MNSLISAPATTYWLYSWPNYLFDSPKWLTNLEAFTTYHSLQRCKAQRRLQTFSVLWPRIAMHCHVRLSVLCQLLNTGLVCNLLHLSQDRTFSATFQNHPQSMHYFSKRLTSNPQPWNSSPVGDTSNMVGYTLTKRTQINTQPVQPEILRAEDKVLSAIK